MKFKPNDKVVFENENFLNNQVMTITRGSHKRHGYDMVLLLLEGGEGIAYANELRLATEEEIEANKRIIKVKHQIQFGIPVMSDRKAGNLVDLCTNVTIGIDLANGPDCTCEQINGEEISTEDRNYTFCQFCVECFKGMTIANDYESINGDDNA